MEKEKCQWWQETYDRVGTDVIKTPVEKEICCRLRNGGSMITYMKEVGYTMEEWERFCSRFLERERDRLCVKLASSTVRSC